MKFNVEIKNCPEYAKNCNYIVAWSSYGTLWFYGGFDDEKSAEQVAKKLGENAVIACNRNAAPSRKEK